MRLILQLFLLFWSTTVFAGIPDIRVQALFAGKAMVSLDGRNQLMLAGQIEQGVKLVSADSRQAVFELPDGQRLTLGLNQSIGSAYRKPKRDSVTMFSGKHGMFTVPGLVNGRRLEFILDTGASFISMSQQQAERLKLTYRQAKRGRVQTASETVPVWHIRLDQVKVGGISVANVEAVILPGNTPATALLGMSFLKHVKMQRNGNAMTLQQKY